MAIHISHHHLAFVFGILGNIVSVMVYLAPMVTFYAIFKGQSTRKYYEVIPYSMTLFSATMILYYAFLKGNEGNEALPLITINAFGSVMQLIYIILFYFLASSRKDRIMIALLVSLFNSVTYFAILISTSFVTPIHRLKVVGWIYVNVSVGVYASPLNGMIKVIRTKSVKSIPMPLSICLTLNAILWFFYGFFSHDYFIAAPNVQGFLLGVAQIVLYFIYKNSGADEKERVASETREDIVQVTIDDEILKIIEVAKSNISGTMVESEHYLQNKVVKGNDKAGDSEIQCMEEESEDEIVEIPDEPRNLTRVNSVARF